MLSGRGWRLAHPQPSCPQGILLGSPPYGQRNEGTEQGSRVSGNEHQKRCQPGSELTLQVPQMIVMVGQGFNEMVREGLLGQRLKKRGWGDVGGGKECHHKKIELECEVRMLAPCKTLVFTEKQATDS